MKIGVVGLGKLGMPVALALSLKGHDVMGFDVDPSRMQKEVFPHREVGPNGELSIEPLLQQSSIRFGALDEVVDHAELVFVAVQTPHEALYEGVTRLPEARADFDYSFLKHALADLSGAVDRIGDDRFVVVISTVLPGTIRREILPLLSERVKLCYNPFFIAMGTTIPDFLNPEFVLFGSHDPGAAEKARNLYATLHDAPLYETSIENAELIKVAYNTFITMKVCFANVLMEISHKIEGCDVDEVSGALALGTERLLSPAYLNGGMGDGGGCHPRDNIALSWLARQLGLSTDWFESIMLVRERQTDWLADLVDEHHARRGFEHRRVGIYGKAFKAGTNLTVGSPATLLCNLLEERGFAVEMFDPYIDAGPCPFDDARVYVVATNHPEFTGADWEYPQGSVVIDPWRAVQDREGVEIVSVGVGQVDYTPTLQDELRVGAAQNGRPSDPERAAALDLA